MTTTVQTPNVVATQTRVQSIDILRGAIMIIMALDHTREYFHNGAQVFSPEDLARTSVALFFARWITHFCAPVFMLTAGLGAFFLGQRRSRSEVSRFLVTRGLWLVVLELVVLRFAMVFNFDYSFTIVTVLWALGLCMVVLAGLIHLPPRVLAILSGALILFHNAADAVPATYFGKAAWVWNLLHQPGLVKLGPLTVLLAYPLIPWVGVMAGGYCLGPVFQWEPERRRRFLLRLGLGLSIAFVVIRFINIYGDPMHWKAQESAVMTVCSFLKVMKYPPSLDFLLMTLGPALIATSYIDRVRLSNANPLLVFGRVPLFYFIVHFFLIHIGAVLMAIVQYGSAGLHMTTPPPMTMGGHPFPPDYGLSLGGVYLAWISVVVVMYPLCRWYGGIKQRHHNWWLSYL